MSISKHVHVQGVHAMRRRKDAAATECGLDAYRKLFKKLVKPEVTLLADLLQNIDEQPDDLDLWLFTEDLETAFTNLRAAHLKLSKLTCDDCINGDECGEHPW